MKTTFAIAAVAGFAAAASAQSVYLTASNTMPADGETVSIDVVLDASNYGGAFFAWHQYNFNVGISADGDATGIGATVSGDDDFASQSAGADTTGDGNLNFGPFGAAWTNGRRPGAFPGAGAGSGGSQFGPFTMVATDTQISGDGGTIGGRQGSQDAESNFNIHQGRVYEAYRFTFVYSDAMGQVDFSLTDVIANVYTTAGSGLNEFVSASTSGVSVGEPIPAPASLALLGLGGMAAARRRRA